jgi:hypothetical protein
MWRRISEAQGRRREAGAEQNRGPMDKNRIRGGRATEAVCLTSGDHLRRVRATGQFLSPRRGKRTPLELVASIKRSVVLCKVGRRFMRWSAVPVRSNAFCSGVGGFVGRVLYSPFGAARFNSYASVEVERVAARCNSCRPARAGAVCRSLPACRRRFATRRRSALLASGVFRDSAPKDVRMQVLLLA